MSPEIRTLYFKLFAQCYKRSSLQNKQFILLVHLVSLYEQLTKEKSSKTFGSMIFVDLKQYKSYLTCEIFVANPFKTNK